jgi:hypothetical protein
MSENKNNKKTIHRITIGLNEKEYEMLKAKKKEEQKSFQFIVYRAMEEFGCFNKNKPGNK